MHHVHLHTLSGYHRAKYDGKDVLSAEQITQENESYQLIEFHTLVEYLGQTTHYTTYIACN